MTISPDGRHVAFLSFDSRSLSAIPVADAEPREIAREAFAEFAWQQKT